MKLKFTARKPKARQAATEPLQAGPKPETAPEAARKAMDKAEQAKPAKPAEKPKELGGPSGPEPTRYGDWERKGICVDF